MPFFLKLKHWQLFLLLIILPVVSALIFQLAMFSEVFEMAAKNASSQMNSFTGFPKVFRWFPLLFIINIVPLFGWLWSFGTTMHKYIPNPKSMKLGRFKAFVIIPFTFLVLLSFWFVYMIIAFENMEAPPEPFGIPKEIALIMLSMIVIFPLYLFSMFCIIYTLRFCAKALVSAERGREAHFGDYVGEFFLIWINFVGLWFIQPRIQAVLATKFPTTIHELNELPNAPSQDEVKDEKPLNFKPDGDPFEHDNDFDGIL